MKPKISVLIAARKNSKFLNKFWNGLYLRTKNISNIEVKIIIPESDTWNNEFFELIENVEVVRESYNYGRAGLHVYFNDLAARATGDWLIYFCEDHFITKDGWDEYLIDYLKDYDPNKAYIVRPHSTGFDCILHMVSRGFYETLGVMGRNAWIDSYLNDVMERIPQDRCLYPPEILFHDFSADDPNPMSEAAQHSVFDPNFKEGHPDYLAFSDPRTRQLVEEDAAKITKSIEEGR